jgi:hypothetical protein
MSAVDLSARALALCCSAALLGCSPTLPDFSVEPGSVADEEAKADGRGGGARVELKLTVADPLVARHALGLDDDQAQARRVWFHDDLELSRFRAGIILRDREIDGESDDVTVKLRPLDAEGVAEDWLRLSGFKCEVDRGPTSSVSSCSLTRVIVEQQLPGELFDQAQRDFLAAHATLADALVGLRTLGPVPTRVWKLTTAELDGKLTVESWRLPDGRELVEVSQKVDAADADAGLAALTTWLEQRGVAVGATSETKTRAALEALVASESP